MDQKHSDDATIIVETPLNMRTAHTPESKAMVHKDIAFQKLFYQKTFNLDHLSVWHFIPILRYFGSLRPVPMDELFMECARCHAESKNNYYCLGKEHCRDLGPEEFIPGAYDTWKLVKFELVKICAREMIPRMKKNAEVKVRLALFEAVVFSCPKFDRTDGSPFATMAHMELCTECQCKVPDHEALATPWMRVAEESCAAIINTVRLRSAYLKKELTGFIHEMMMLRMFYLRQCERNSAAAAAAAAVS
jgi:hypothetical protein